jgi:hypothetical protein
MRASTNGSRRWGLAILAAGAIAGAAASGCTGTFDQGVAPPPGVVTGPDTPSPSSQVPRLSHLQWENATTDLLRLPAPSGLSSSFIPDSTRGLFDNAGGELSVGTALWSDYQRAAERLAETVTTDATALARILPEGLPADPTMRARAFVVGFGRRAYRRPLSNDETAAYVTLFATGAAAFPDMSDSFAAGVRVVLEAMLQSPNFLYRPELSTAQIDGLVPLSDDEMASRLSFALWNTMPDDELFAAAAAHQLTNDATLRTQVARMLQDPRARTMVVAFHDQLLLTSRALDVNRATSLFPEFDPALPASMVGETRAFVEHAVFDDHGSLTTLLTAPYTYVDERLAPVYGLSGTFGPGFTRVSLDTTQRAGLFTQIGFLSVNATSTETDPIHRGVFLHRRMLCTRLPAPPMMVPPLPPDDPSMPHTMRERVTTHTGPGTCGATCHGTTINPIGFAYEHYDALGRWRDRDHDLPIDASDSYAFGGLPAHYDGAVELGRVMSEQVSTHRCYTQHWLEYAYGRAVSSADDAILTRVGRASRRGELDVLGILTELVTSPSFTHRSAAPYAGVTGP